MISKTSESVEQNTSYSINALNNQRIDKNLERYSMAGNFAIDRRLDRLDREWTTERLIELEAPIMISFGSVVAYFFGRRWIFLPFFSASMLLLHGVQGWYPLLPLFRRLGFRSQNEILKERRGLLSIRNNSSERH